MYRKGTALRRRVTQDRRSIFRKELEVGLTWWGIGILAGVIFAIALGKEIRQSLGQYLQTGMEQIAEIQADYFDYFLKRTYSYVKLFLVVWVLTYWNYGSWGIKILLGGKGFLQGYAQAAWIFAYGLRGIILGAAALCPHNILLLLWITGICCITRWLKQVDKSTRLVIQGGLTILLAMSVAAVEAYITPVLLQAAG